MYVRTDDGRRIAYDREGSGGRPLVLVGGLGQTRATDPATRTLTGELAARGLDVVHHDRPGRGDSTGDPPFTLDGEIAAIRALVDELGGRAALYGSSSGGAIALAAATRLPGVDHLVLWETPVGTDGPADATAWPEGIVERTATGDHEAVLRFAMDGMPPEWLEGMLGGPDRERYLRLAPTTAADAEALAWAAGALQDGSLGGVTVPTTVLTGTSAWPFLVEAADALAAALPAGGAGRCRAPRTAGSPPTSPRCWSGSCSSPALVVGNIPGEPDRRTGRDHPPSHDEVPHDRPDPRTSIRCCHARGRCAAGSAGAARGRCVGRRRRRGRSARRVQRGEQQLGELSGNDCRATVTGAPIEVNQPGGGQSSVSGRSSTTRRPASNGDGVDFRVETIAPGSVDISDDGIVTRVAQGGTFVEDGSTVRLESADGRIAVFTFRGR